jgi:hypothetical protein
VRQLAFCFDLFCTFALLYIIGVHVIGQALTVDIDEGCRQVSLPISPKALVFSKFDTVSLNELWR